MNGIEAEIKLAQEMFEDALLTFKAKRTRTCVNRAYYAMFHATRAILLSFGTDCHSHAGAINRFGEEVIKKGLASEKLAKSLHRAYRLREKSDYQPAVKINLEDAKLLLGDAKDFIAEIEGLVKKGKRDEK